MRRWVARGGLAVVAATLVSTGVVAVAPSPGRPQLSDHTTTLDAGGTHGPGWDTVVPTGIGAEMAGFTWTGGAATLRVRGFDGRTWSDWVQLDGSPDEGPDSSSAEFTADKVSAGPTWLGHDITTAEVQVVTGTVTDLQLHAINSEPAQTSGSAFGVLAAPPADAAVPPAFVISRADWGADESFRTINDGCDGKPDYASSTRFAVVHHTVNSNNYAPGDSASLVRGIYYFHTHDNGWCDIGYNFLIDRYGQVFEGRAGGPNRSVIGAHAGGFNTYSTGVALIGNFDVAGVPQAAYDALRGLLTWKLSYHGIDPLGTSVIFPYDSEFSRFPAGQPVEVDNISGHTDVDSTECPGRYLYALLPRLRQDVAHDIARFPDTRLMGDWDGKGTAGVGVYQNGWFFLRDSQSEGQIDHLFPYGDPGDIPVVGDWNGDGIDTVGVVRNGVWYLRNSNTPGTADIVFTFGDPHDRPVVGDWNGDGITTAGVYRGATWYLRDSNSTGVADRAFNYGDPTDVPVAGDWNGDGTDSPGVFRGGVWYLRNTTTTGVADATVAYGDGHDTPLPYRVSGSKWALAVARGSYWFLSKDITSGSAANVFPF